MKWVLSGQFNNRHRWVLHNAGQPAAFTYDLQHRSVRLKAADNHLFFLETVGLLHKRVRLRSEYGVVLGEAQLANKGKQGLVALDSRKSFFRWTDGRLKLLNRDGSVLFEAAVECREDTDLLERYAFVFCSAWLGQGATAAERAEPVTLPA